MKSFIELRESLKEAALGKLPDPPPMIVLRRIGIRNFPHGEKIALYHNDKLNLDVSVPYSNDGKNDVTKLTYASIREEVNSLDETIIKKLQIIANKPTADNVNFGNGSFVQVQPVVAQKILTLYKRNDLTFANRVKLSRFVSGNPKAFKAVVDFVNQMDGGDNQGQGDN